MGKLFILTGVVAAMLLTVTAGCKRDKIDHIALKRYETPAWAGEGGMLQVATESEDSRVVLLRKRPTDEGMNELFGAETLDPDLDSDEVIYRYDPVEDPIELEVVDLRAWFAATGPRTWDLQQVRRVPSRLHVSWSSGKLGFGRHEVPTVGTEIVHMAMSMETKEKFVAILSAHRMQDDFETMQSWGGPRLERFYHQAYDVENLEPVGEPVYLPFTYDDPSPQGMWAGHVDFVVYTDALFRKVFIVDIEELRSRRS